MNSMHQVAVVIDNALQAKVVVKHHPIEQEAMEKHMSFPIPIS